MDKALLYYSYAFGNIQCKRYDKATEAYLRFIDYYRSTGLEECKALATAYNNLGMCCNELNDPQKALEYLKRAAEMMIDLFGDKYKTLFIIYCNFYYSYDLLKMPEEAERYRSLAIEIMNIYNFPNDSDYA